MGNVTGGYLHQLTEQKVLQGFFHTVSGVWNSQITEVVQVGGRCYYYYFFFSFRFFFLLLFLNLLGPCGGTKGVWPFILL